MDKREILTELDELKNLLHEARAYVINNHYMEARGVVVFEMQEKLDDVIQVICDYVDESQRGEKQ